MRISDWSSDVCSSDLREEATRMRGRDTGKPAGSCRHSRVPRDAASRRLLGMRGGNPGTPAHARATARVPGLPLLALRVRPEICLATVPGRNLVLRQAQDEVFLKASC